MTKEDISLFSEEPLQDTNNVEIMGLSLMKLCFLELETRSGYRCKGRSGETLYDD